ncbi:MAG TPA: ribokinase, partial [Acidimicrobiales bacterium]|nr:ribokinase [Acidimicrobiales bacterium]
GVALITIDPEDVSIIVVAGANAALSAEMVEESGETITAADVLLLQGEVGAAAAVAAARIAREAGTRVVFNPAPFNEVAPAVLPLADVVIVNRGEARMLAEVAPKVEVETLVTTLGAGGSEVRFRGEVTLVEGFEAVVVDPTGAGDCFAAALAVALAEGADPVAAARFANAAGSRAVEVAGAQPSMPTRAQVEDRLRS